MVSLVHTILNATVFPSGVLFVMFLTPVVVFLKFIGWLFRFPESVDGKVVVITGAASGIGEQLAYLYAKAGALLMLGAQQEDMVRDVVHRCEQLGARAVQCTVVDSSQERDCRRLIERVVEAYGAINHLVNCEGSAHSFFFDQAKETSSFRPLMDTNFWSNIYTTKAAMEYLRQSKGTIAIVSSVAGFLPYPSMSLYNASKAALINFFDSLRVEVAPDVHITLALPGCSASEMAPGRGMNVRGEQMLDFSHRLTHWGPLPMLPPDVAAKQIFDAICKKRERVIVPSWYSLFLYYRILAPEILEWGYRIILTGKQPQMSKKEA